MIRKDKKMNYIEQFMKDNDIEVNEDFYVINEEGEKIKNISDDEHFLKFHFTEKLEFKSELINLICTKLFLSLMLGRCKIEKIPQKDKTVWDLKEEEDYYYIDMCGNVDRTTFRNSTYFADEKVIKIGNAFLTKEEAKHEAERRKCEAVLLKYGTRDLMSLGDKYTKKYYIQYDYDVNKIIILKHYSIGIQGVINFKTEEMAQKAIEEVGEDRLKKYIFNVKE